MLSLYLFLIDLVFLTQSFTWVIIYQTTTGCREADMLPRVDYFIKKYGSLIDLGSLIFCNSCNAKLPSDDPSYCHKCGTKIEQLVTPIVTTRIRVETIKVCPICSHENSMEVSKCLGCKSKFAPTGYCYLYSSLDSDGRGTGLPKISKVYRWPKDSKFLSL